MLEISLVDLGLDSDPNLRSPCFDCPKMENNKLDKECERCEVRIEYAKKIAGPPTIEELEDIQSKHEYSHRIKRPKLCECGGIHYAKGLCRKCYQRKKYKEYKLSGLKSSVVTVSFGSTKGGKELLSLVKMIAEREQRSVNSQIVVFAFDGVYRWLEENGE